MKNYRIQIIGANLSFLDSSRISVIGCVFAECDPFKPTIFIQQFIYIDFL